MQNQSPAEVTLGQNLRRPRIVVALALALVAVSATPWILASMGSPVGIPGAQTDRIGALERRIAAMELAQKQNQAQVLAQLSRLAADRGARIEPSAEQLAKQEAQRVHRQRLQDDPAYLLQHQTRRLNELQASLQSEPVDPAWSEQTSHHVNEVIATSSAQSGNPIKTSSVDCRSTRCRISLEIPAGGTYEELLMYLNTDLAEVLPRSRLVVMPMSDGTQQVHIFAQAGTGTAANPPRRD